MQQRQERGLNPMQVFISWSKQISHGLAQVLHRWLPDVIHRLEPWMSSEDISKGQRWGTEVGARLDNTSQGIICVTRENMKEPWLSFEAGALAKSIRESVVRPILLDVKPSEITGPLNQFQATVATDEQDMLKLVKSLNERCDVPLENNRLERTFRRTWDEYLKDVRTIVTSNATPEMEPQRQMSDILGEVLERIRDVQRSLTQVTDTVQPRDVVASSGDPVVRPRRGLASLVNVELLDLAMQLGIEDRHNMRRGELINLIKQTTTERQSESKEEG